MQDPVRAEGTVGRRSHEEHSACLLVVVASGCSGPGSTGQDSIERVTQAITAGTAYTLKLPLMTGDTGNCVDVEGASLLNKAKIQEWDCNGTGAQSFQSEDVGGVVPDEEHES